MRRNTRNKFCGSGRQVQAVSNVLFEYEATLLGVTLLLITGIPATGKTKVGNFLRDNKGFVHVDFEDPQAWPSQLQRQWGTPRELVDYLKNMKRPIVVTWGFMPGSSDEAVVRYFQEAGFTLIWFDGNREAARRAFIARGTVPTQALDAQMVRINNMDLAAFEPIIIDTFDSAGNFLPINDVVELVIAATSNRP
jgi:hypothetical protein